MLCPLTLLMFYVRLIFVVHFELLEFDQFSDPPSQPFIHGYTKGTNVPAGTLQKISCTSSGGNPLATMTWYKNDKKVSLSYLSENCQSLP